MRSCLLPECTILSGRRASLGLGCRPTCTRTRLHLVSGGSPKTSSFRSEVPLAPALVRELKSLYTNWNRFAKSLRLLTKRMRATMIPGETTTWGKTGAASFRVELASAGWHTSHLLAGYEGTYSGRRPHEHHDRVFCDDDLGSITSCLRGEVQQANWRVPSQPRLHYLASELPTYHTH